MAFIGQKRILAFGGRMVPFVITGAPRETTVQRPSTDPNRRGQLVSFPALMVEGISLRETNPANGPVRKYLVKTEENTRWLYDRDDHVVGLDVTEDGELITISDLNKMALASAIEYQQERLVAQQPAEIPFALIAAEDAEAHAEAPTTKPAKAN